MVRFRNLLFGDSLVLNNYSPYVSSMYKLEQKTKGGLSPKNRALFSSWVEDVFEKL